MAVLAFLKVAVLSIIALLAAAIFCFYFFTVIQTFAYRLVIIFIVLIFVSNFLSSLLADYLDNKKIKS